jgi:hypothetical protein
MLVIELLVYILDIGKSCYSLPYIDYCGCSTRLLTLLNTDLSSNRCYSGVDIELLSLHLAKGAKGATRGHISKH